MKRRAESWLGLGALWVGAVCSALPAHAQSAPAAAPTSSASVQMLDAHNRVFAPKQALGISRHITHDSTLSRSARAEEQSADPENFRLELLDADERARVVYARIESLGPDGSIDGVLRHVPLVRVGDQPRFRSPFIRLVTDATDASAPDIGGQLLRARLRGTIRAVVERGNHTLSAALPVGVSDSSDSSRQVLKGTLRVTVLRLHRGGPPVVGDRESEAAELARSQVEIANEIWAQCFIEFGDPMQAEVRVVDPPPPALLSVGELDGLPAQGGGTVSFRVNGTRIAPVTTRPGANPEQTALAIARAVRAAGFRAEVTVNPRAELGAGSSADIVMRDRHGLLARVSEEPGVPLSSDPQQRVAVGHVDLADGIDEFDNTLAATGTLEERTLIKLLGDSDPTTIDVFLINRFVNRDRQGEAFIEADGSSLANTLIFDRNAVRYERQAWVQAHELGHVLLDEAFHPDNLGVDRPWLLMDADARQGRVTGPKRLSDEECAKARRRSGPGAYPVLLKPRE
ncbi:MAG: hypothetical protein QM778_04410 [Myxococcales bacterium]